MMRQIVTYLITALICMVFVSENPAFGAVAENSDLAKLVSQYNDTHMTVKIWPSIHNFDATPKDGYVRITVNGRICKAAPTTKLGTRN